MKQRGHMAARWITGLVLAATSVTGHVQTYSQHRFTITQKQVAQAIAHTLSDKGILIVEDQVSLVAKVVATDSSPALRIASMQQFVDNSSVRHLETRAMVKLDCLEPAACLPFYAVVSWPKGSVGYEKNALDTATSVRRNISKPTKEIVMHVGARAILTMDDNRAQIQISVISLENGEAGRRIRVASFDRKQIYFGEIVGPSLLKGTF
jgi:hypothetical protein